MRILAQTSIPSFNPSKSDRLLGVSRVRLASLDHLAGQCLPKQFRTTSPSRVPAEWRPRRLATKSAWKFRVYRVTRLK